MASSEDTYQLLFVSYVLASGHDLVTRLIIPNVPPAPLRLCRLQCRRCQNHWICLHLLLLIAQFAAWALGISSPPNLHRSLPWSAPQVLYPPEAGKRGRPSKSLPDSASSTEQRPDPTQLQWVGCGVRLRRRGSHTARAVEDLAEREPPCSQVVWGHPTYRLSRHWPVWGRSARLVRGLHATGPDLGDTHRLCLAKPQHILQWMNAIAAAREGPLLKRK